MRVFENLINRIDRAAGNLFLFTGLQQFIARQPAGPGADIGIHFRARGFFPDVEHPEVGRSFAYPGAAAIYPKSPWRIYRRAPLIGEDTQAVLDEIGVDASAFAALRAAGVV